MRYALPPDTVSSLFTRNPCYPPPPEHMDVCLVCWDGGELLCCDHCPAAYHPECLGYTPAEMKQLERKRWACPHHSCAKCDRNTGRAGGLLFR